MAKCECCGKGVTFGIKVSHSHRRSNRTWKPNVRRVKMALPSMSMHAPVACALARLPALSKSVVYVAGHVLLAWPAFCFGARGPRRDGKRCIPLWRCPATLSCC